MKKVRLGKTDLMVSEVGFGGIPIIPMSLEDAMKVVGHGFDRGITFFDSANMYGDSEKKISQALEPVRDNVILATKTLKRDAEGVADSRGAPRKSWGIQGICGPALVAGRLLCFNGKTDIQ